MPWNKFQGTETARHGPVLCQAWLGAKPSMGWQGLSMVSDDLSANVANHFGITDVNCLSMYVQLKTCSFRLQLLRMKGIT